MFKENDTQIGTLNVRGGGTGTDRPALFRRLSFLLNTVDFRPPGIPPSGILIVRRMEDPLPGNLTTGQNTHRANPGWERAAQNLLLEKYRKASRPVRGFIPSGAEAVFFEDESQLLAALALDIANGAALDRWWWKLTLKKIDPASHLVKLLCEKITLLPAAFSHLAAWGEAPPVLEKLSRDDALTLLAAVSREFRLERVTAPLFQPGNEEDRAVIPSGPIKGEKRAIDHGSPPARIPGQRENSYPSAPWDTWLPSRWSAAQLEKHRAALLGLALSLFHSLPTVYTPSFAAAFHRWWGTKEWTGHETDETTDHETPPSPSPGTKEGAKEGKVRTGHETDETTDHETPPSPSLGTKERTKEGTGHETGEKTRIGTRIRFHSHEHDEQEPTGKGAPGPELPGISTPLEKETLSPTQPTPARDIRSPFPEEGVETRLAGVFYLVNLMERLDLPACFEEPCQPASRVGAWGVLELLAHALLEDQYPELQSDPLWEALARLDNREKGTPPGNDFYYIGEYTLPEIWEGKFEIRSTKSETNSNASDFHINRWVRFVMPYIKNYLRQWVKPPDGEETDIIKMVLLTGARLYVTATHVDVVMGLGDISMPVRMAGLDRDPGWKPKFARVILFHFN